MSLNKKVIVIQALRDHWDAPPINEPWSNFCDRNLTRLLQCSAWHLEHFEAGLVPLDADVYTMCSFDVSLLDREIEMVKKLKSLGKKVIVGFSADLRFLIGNCLMSPTGTIYTELCKHVDLIMSAASPDLHLYGRYQDKVIPFGVPFERGDLSTIPYKDRPIDVLVSSSIGEECISQNLEILLMFKEKRPDIRIMYNTQPSIIDTLLKRYQDRIEFVHGWLADRLPYAKTLLSPELRPRSGRCLDDAWKFRVPFVSVEWAYHSRLFPDFTFREMSMDHIVNQVDKLLNADYNTIIKKAEEIAEYDYFDIAWPRILKRLFPDEYK